jgi:hypothetical protein
MADALQDRVDAHTMTSSGPKTAGVFRRFLGWLGWIVLALLLVEVGLRLAHIGYPNGGKELFFTWDPHTGIAPRPGAQGFWHTSEYDVPVHINSQGLRDREHAFQKPLPKHCKCRWKKMTLPSWNVNWPSVLRGTAKRLRS